ncbi:MAG: nucleotidyl transferase AbiEii/AbiGii toxin family protein [Thermomicrobiales bacterium]
MTEGFHPRLDVLPSAQQRLWPELRAATSLGFVLYGGTAIALHLGHRPSVDFDFFSEHSLNRDRLRTSFPFIGRSTMLQDRSDAFTVLVPSAATPTEEVRVSFFGPIGFGRVGEPRMTSDGVMQVASLDDLMATKLKVILQRVEAKDYRDVAAMVRAGVDLAKGLSSARAMYGRTFQPSESLKALVYFEGGDLETLMDADRHTLIGAVGAVRELPAVTMASRSLQKPVEG